MGQAAGWYVDPFAREQERYWDGRVWTQGTRPAGAAGPLADRAVTEMQEAEGSSYLPLGVPTRAGAAAASPLTPAGWAPRATEPGGNRSLRRAVFAIGAAALLLVGGGAAAAFVLGGSHKASASEAVSQAASQTIAAQSADMSMTMNLSFPGANETMTGSGAFDFADNTGTMTLNIPAGAEQLTEQTIYDGSTVYVSVGNLLGSIAQGKQWVSVDTSLLNSAAGSLNGLNTMEDPASMLQQFQSLGGTVTSDGKTTYEGTPVTQYSVDLPPSALENAMGGVSSSLQHALSGVSLPNIVGDVYVTADGLLKAVHLPITLSVAGQSFSMDMTMSLSNYGTPVTVTPPPASQVLPFSQLPGALGSLGNSGNTGIFGNAGNSGDSGSAL